MSPPPEEATHWTGRMLELRLIAQKADGSNNG
jgi:hypothetical protein